MSILGNPETIISATDEELKKRNLHTYYSSRLENKNPGCVEDWGTSVWIKEAIDLSAQIISRSRSSYGKALCDLLSRNSLADGNNRLTIQLEEIPEDHFHRKFTEIWPIRKDKEEIIDLSSEEYRGIRALGEYFPLGKKIILDDKKIQKSALGINVVPTHLFLIVFLHELMHFLMDPSNYDSKLPGCAYPDNSVSSFWMEESYANGMMLNMLMSYGCGTLFTTAKTFVRNQPKPYKFGLELMKTSIKYKLWINEKVFIITGHKSVSGPTYLISCSSRKWKGTMPARVLYSASMLFNYSYLYALKNNASKIYIFSDKHHLISKDKLIKSYNKKFHAKEKWHKKVGKQLSVNGVISNIVVLSGQKYYKGLGSLNPVTPLSGMKIGQSMHFLQTEYDNSCIIK